MSFQICIDVGGTFTDLALIDEKGELRIFKSPTTPANQADGIIAVLQLATEYYSMPLSRLLTECGSPKGGTLSHGSTVATNAIIEGKTGKVGLICTKGFRDILNLREGRSKSDPYNFDMDYPLPYVPKYLTLPVTERINSEGGIEVPLNEDEVRQIVRQLKKWKVEAIAVSLLWSIANPVHELRIGDIVKKEWPEIPCTLSHQLNPIIREYRRTSSAAINASLMPIVSKYISNLDKRLREEGYPGELSMLTSSGGVISVEEIVDRPIYSVDNGPAMAPVAGKLFATTELGTDDVITVDMGGTSFDVSCVTRGAITVSRETIVGNTIIGINKVDTRSIGAGGGSISWVDTGGLLHVGPASAGAVPGPACYGRSGKEATVTDANLVLGYLDPGYFLGGAIKLNRELAEKVVQQKVGDPLKLKLAEAAFSIWSTVNINMVTAISDITIWQGIDPREYLFVAGGGAAGLHIAAIMQELGVKRALVPRVAGALSATGGLFADIVCEYNTNYYTKSSHFDYEGVSRTLENLEERAESFFKRTKVAPKNRKLEFYVEAHYPYQIWELIVPLRVKRISNAKELEQLVEDFHEVHNRVYAVKEPGQYIECVSWGVRAIGTRHMPELKERPSAGEDSSAALIGKRKAYFKALGGSVETPVYRGDKLVPGNKIAPPAIIEEPTTTIVISPKSKITVTKWGNYLLELDQINDKG
ncbi:MAG: hydantoinase/oxoprolinase family protein [Dehalococcoidia bacterium]|nr:hydantoinase/oxoprolinase family protein [Dehalococcoidia bacterium]